MTVYLKGLDGRCDQVEENVKSVKVDDTYIEINYFTHKWGFVSGVKYYANEMKIEKVVW